jgi:hypothetical protein
METKVSQTNRDEQSCARLVLDVLALTSLLLRLLLLL